MLFVLAVDLKSKLCYDTNIMIIIKIYDWNKHILCLIEASWSIDAFHEILSDCSIKRTNCQFNNTPILLVESDLSSHKHLILTVELSREK